MLRLFETTTLRKQTELSGKLWDFSAPVGDHKTAFVPSCWETYPGLERYRGSCAYQTVFTGGGNLRLVFKGVSFFAKVYLDGKFVGEHYNAYTPFECIVKDAAEGEHMLRVEASNEFSDQSALHVDNDYRSWGGISRGVMTETLSDAYIRTLHAVPKRKDGQWVLSLTMEIENLQEQPLEVQPFIYLQEQSLRLDAVALPAGGRKVLQAEMLCPGVETYTLENPVMYMVRAAIASGGAAIDDLIERVGFRTVEVKDHKIYFNDQPLLIHGFNRHESHGLYGCALPFEAMVQDLDIMKDLGANAVRTSHYPNDELFLDLCDERGVLLWEEVHTRTFDLKQLSHPLYRSQSLDCIHEMMEAHMNHPSIFIWGCLNECQSDCDYGRECYLEQFNEIKRLDTSRPVTAASSHPGLAVFNRDPAEFKPREPGFHDGDICLDMDDVVSFNIYPRWYYDLDPAVQVKKLLKWIDENQGKGKPVIISEIGAGAISGFHSAAHDTWSEEKQADILEEVIHAVLGNPDTAGIFLWQYCDVLVDEGWGLVRPKTMNNKGIVDEFRRPKLGYDVVKRLFHQYAKSRPE